MAIVSSMVVDHSNKLNLIRSYLGTFTDSEISRFFANKTLDQILEDYTYDEISSVFVNVSTMLEEADINIGYLVRIKSPVYLDGSYQSIEGVVVGSHLVYDYIDSKKGYKRYHTAFDVLIIQKIYTDSYNPSGYAYQIKSYTAKDIEVVQVVDVSTGQKIAVTLDDTADFFSSFNTLLARDNSV